MKILLKALVVAGMVGTVMPIQAATAQTGTTPRTEVDPPIPTIMVTSEADGQDPVSDEKVEKESVGDNNCPAGSYGNCNMPWKDGGEIPDP